MCLGEWGVTTKVSFLGDENVLKLIVVIVAQPENILKTNDLYTLRRVNR